MLNSLCASAGEMERRVAMVAVMRCVSFIVVLCLLFYGCGDGGGRL